MRKFGPVCGGGAAAGLMAQNLNKGGFIVSNKVCSLHDAIAKYVESGDQISFGGFTTNKKPMAAVREILRQGHRMGRTGWFRLGYDDR